MHLADCYRLLDLEPEASPEEVKRAYRDLAKVWHPDRFAHDDSLRRKAEEKLKAINEAYAAIARSRGEAWDEPSPDEPYAWRVRSHGRELRFADLASIAHAAGRGTLREGAEVFDPAAERWSPITAFPELRVAVDEARLRRNRAWAFTFAIIAIAVLFRRPSPAGLLIALVLFAVALLYGLRARRRS